MRTALLDHGYVELIEPWGTGRDGVGPEPDAVHDYEVGIIEAARQSTQASFRGWETDSKLLKTLYENNHSTPFEFAGMVIEVQAPILVFREWHRHRTQSYNEMSARYAPLPDLMYLPSQQRLMMVNQKTGNRQAQGVSQKELLPGVADHAVEIIREQCRQSRRSYEALLEMGVAKEIARSVLPFAQYSRMRAAANLRNWLAFMTLRCDPNAQWEIRQYAWAVAEIIRLAFPQTHALWTGRFSQGAVGA